MLSDDYHSIDLEESIRLNDLMAGGTTFRIKSESISERLDRDIFDYVGSDDENSDSEDLESRTTPWKKSYAELKVLMEMIPVEFGSVFKRTVDRGIGEQIGSQKCRILWSYSMFQEGDENAFDFSTKPVHVQMDDIMIGLQFAMQSMRKNELSHFVIDYKLMFGEFGCLPRIKPKQDILLVVKLEDFEEIGDDKACDNLTDEDRRKFCVLKEKFIDMQKSAEDNIKHSRYNHAITTSTKAIRNLELCHLASEEEQKEQQKLLIDFYKKLICAYDQTKKWKKVCSMVNELRRITNISHDVDILVFEAKALGQIGDHKRSIILLRKAQKIAPHDGKVNGTLDHVLKEQAKYDAECKEIWKRAFSQ